MVGSHAFRSPAIRAPPNTPVSMLTRVMPICTVGRNRCGSPASSRAVVAPGTPLRSRTASRARRTETSASSLIENTPFTTISSRTMMISRPMPMAQHNGRRRSSHSHAARRVADGRMPLLAILLSVLGLVPFIVCGLAALGPDPATSARMLSALIGYAAVTLAFAGGIHWGFELQSRQQDSVRPARAARARRPPAAGRLDRLAAAAGGGTVDLAHPADRRLYRRRAGGAGGRQSAICCRHAIFGCAGALRWSLSR